MQKNELKVIQKPGSCTQFVLSACLSYLFRFMQYSWGYNLKSVGAQR